MNIFIPIAAIAALYKTLNKKPKNTPFAIGDKMLKDEKYGDYITYRQYQERRAPDYDFTREEGLNPEEKIFRDMLQKSIAKRGTGAPPLYILERKPLCGKGGCELGYVTQRQLNGQVVDLMVIPKIKTDFELNVATHESCHYEDGHHDPTHPNYQLSNIEKERQVDDCSEKKYAQYGKRWRYRRSDKNLQKVYGNK